MIYTEYELQNVSYDTQKTEHRYCTVIKRLIKIKLGIHIDDILLSPRGSKYEVDVDGIGAMVKRDIDSIICEYEPTYYFLDGYKERNNICHYIM